MATQTIDYNLAEGIKVRHIKKKKKHKRDLKKKILIRTKGITLRIFVKLGIVEICGKGQKAGK